MDDPTVIVVPPNTMPRIGTLYKTQAKYNSENNCLVKELIIIDFSSGSEQPFWLFPTACNAFLSVDRHGNDKGRIEAEAYPVECEDLEPLVPKEGVT
jgi:hypothetical protein